MNNIKLYVGLDVHKDTVTAATAKPGRTTPELFGTFGGSLVAIERSLRKLAKKKGLDLSQLGVCYEAGPCGYVIARRLEQLKVECSVVAPSLIAKGSGDRVKTDTRDALRLARLHRSGELTPVYIPDAADEAVRDLCRARTDAVEELKAWKQRTGAFMLRVGLPWRGASNWTDAHMEFLRNARLGHKAQYAVLEEYLLGIADGMERVGRIEDHMEAALHGWCRSNTVAGLRAFRGIDTVSAMVLASELGPFARYPKATSLMQYLGLVPSENSSGDKRRQGGITKAGNAHSRWILCEAAQHYSREPRVGAPLSRRQKGIDKEIVKVSWNAQRRIHDTYRKMLARKVPRSKVVTAAARELSGFVWDAALRAEGSK